MKYLIYATMFLVLACVKSQTRKIAQIDAESNLVKPGSQHLPKKSKKDSMIVFELPKLDSNTNYLQIKICDKDSNKCSLKNIVDQYDSIMLPNVGKYTVQIFICPNNGDCLAIDEFLHETKESKPQLLELNKAYMNHSNKLQSQLEECRKILKKMATIFYSTGEIQLSENIEKMGELDDTELTYILSKAVDEIKETLDSSKEDSQVLSQNQNSAQKDSYNATGKIILSAGAGAIISLAGVGLATWVNGHVLEKGKFIDSYEQINEFIIDYTKTNRQGWLKRMANPQEDGVNKIYFKNIEILLSVPDVLVNPEPLGKGSMGTAYMINRNGEQFIVKIPNTAPKLLKAMTKKGTELSYLTQLTYDFISEDVDVAIKMAKGFGNPMIASMQLLPMNFTSNSGTSIQYFVPVVSKDFIKGTSLKKSFEDGTYFKNPRMRKKLGDLIFAMGSDPMHYVYGDLNPENLIWSEKHKKWVVIDAKYPTTAKDWQATVKGNLKSFKDKLNPSILKRLSSRSGFAQYLPSNKNDPNLYAKIKNEIKLISSDLEKRLLNEKPKSTISPEMADIISKADSELAHLFTKISQTKAKKETYRKISNTSFKTASLGILAGISAIAIAKKNESFKLSEQNNLENLFKRLGIIYQKIRNTLILMEQISKEYMIVVES